VYFFFRTTPPARSPSGEAWCKADDLQLKTGFSPHTQAHKPLRNPPSHSVIFPFHGRGFELRILPGRSLFHPGRVLEEILYQCGAQGAPGTPSVPEGLVITSTDLSPRPLLLIGGRAGTQSLFRMIGLAPPRPFALRDVLALFPPLSSLAFSPFTLTLSSSAVLGGPFCGDSLLFFLRFQPLLLSPFLFPPLVEA